MLARWSSTVIRARWLVLAAGLVLALAGAGGVAGCSGPVTGSAGAADSWNPTEWRRCGRIWR